VVFDVVVRAARQVLSDLTPAISIDLVQLKDSLILLGRPLDFLDVRVQMIVPPMRHTAYR